MISRVAPILLCATVAGCSSNRASESNGNSPPVADPASPAPATTPAVEEVMHRVVFADRTSYAYLLLLDGPEKAPVPARAELATLVRERMKDRMQEEEVSLLLEFIMTDPRQAAVDPTKMGQTDEELQRQAAHRLRDLLGTYIDVLEVAEDPEKPLIDPARYDDPVLTRDLNAVERASLRGRRHALLLRGEYRNQFGVRGLRLLQTLVRIVAADRDALIHDWDTGETMNLLAFERRRLQAGLGNVADQIAVVPFPALDGSGGVRLSTRGMRRFGSPELELDGLPRDVEVLQRATHLLYGLVFHIAESSQVDASGFAVQAEEMIVVRDKDIDRAYSSRTARLGRCDDCEGEARVHLVRREAHPTDPRGHPVARVVAPRGTSDGPSYQHAAWVKDVLARILGA